MSEHNAKANKDNKPSFGKALTLGAVGAVIGGAVLAIGQYLWNAEEKSEEKERDQSYAATFRDDKDKQRVPPEPSSVCVICLERLEEPIELLPCGHIYHCHCLKDSLQEDMRCPQCRYPLIGDIANKYMERLRH